jgi:hypothetical protein
MDKESHCEVSWYGCVKGKQAKRQETFPIVVPTPFSEPEERREISAGDQSEGCETHSFSSSVRTLPGSHPSIPPSRDLALGRKGPCRTPCWSLDVSSRDF